MENKKQLQNSPDKNSKPPHLDRRALNPAARISAPKAQGISRFGGKIYLWILAALSIIIIILIFYFIKNNNEIPKIDVAQINSIPQKQIEQNDNGTVLYKLNLSQPEIFAKAEEQPAPQATPSVPQNKPNLSQAVNLSSFPTLTDAQRQALNNPGFFLSENNIISAQDEWENTDDFVDTYKKFQGSGNPHERKSENTVFITSDAGLHLYHILIDRSFQSIEQNKFQPMLRDMTKALFLDSMDKYNKETNQTLKNSYAFLSAYYLIPLIVLDSASSTLKLNPNNFPNYADYMKAQEEQDADAPNKKLIFALTDKTYDGIALPDEVYNLASQELTLINNGKGIESSPLFTPLRPDFQNDYSQFVPRSHYTKNNILKSYFIAMMWYGRMGFPISSPDLTRDAIIITGQINDVSVGTSTAAQIWSNMSDAIGFFVGEVDDLTAYQYTNELKNIFGNNLTINDVASPEAISKFTTQAKKDMPLPKILSEAIMMEDYDSQSKNELLADTLQFRFMGQRFTPDAYFLNSLTQGDESPDPETGQKLPTMPTALMPISVIAPQNQVVKNYLEAWVLDPARIKKQGRDSDKVIAKVYNQLVAEFNAVPQSEWTKNIYWGWLNCFKTLLQNYGAGYPPFMQGNSWQDKLLGTVLGSYTELKHDTLLYAKQSYAELGGGGPEETKLPPVPKGYVEPNLTFWNNLLNLAIQTQTGLKERGVFPEEFEDKYNTFIETVKFLQSMAAEELNNQVISDDDFEKLRTINYSFKRITDPLPGEELTTKEKRAAIIADIHTDVPHNEILYEATGKPYVIFTLVSDANGARIVRGAVYDHFEFTHPIDGRLTDEDWQADVYKNEAPLPPQDIWSEKLIK